MKERRTVDAFGNTNTQQWADADYPADFAVEDDLHSKLRDAVQSNMAFVGAAKPPTAAAQASAAYDQTVKLTKQTNALIRVVFRLFDSTAGT